MDTSVIITELDKFIADVHVLKEVYEKKGGVFGKDRYKIYKVKLDAYLKNNLPKENDLLNSKIEDEKIDYGMVIPSPQDKFWDNYGTVIASFLESLILDIKNGDYEMRHQEYIFCQHLQDFLTHLNNEISESYNTSLHYGEVRCKSWQKTVSQYLDNHLPQEVDRFRAVIHATDLDDDSIVVVEEFWPVKKHKIESYINSLILDLMNNHYVFEDQMVNIEVEQTKDNRMHKGKKVFISHSDKDIRLAKTVIDFLEDAVGVEHNQIFCSSVDTHGIPVGETFIEYMTHQDSRPDIVIALLTPSYLKSQRRLCELGAGIVNSEMIFPFFIPPVESKDLLNVDVGVPIQTIQTKISLSNLVKHLHEKPYVDGLIYKKWETQSDILFSEIQKAIDDIAIPEEGEYDRRSADIEIASYKKRLRTIGCDIKKLVETYDRIEGRVQGCEVQY